MAIPGRMIGWVLISLDKPIEEEVLQKLLDLDKVDEASILFGEYDLIAKVEASSAEELGAYIIDNIRTIDGVNLTSTLIAAK